MKGLERIGESMELGIILSIVVAGINSLLGIFLLPFGIIGIIFAIIDVVLAIYMKKIKKLYSSGDYVRSKNILKFVFPLGIIFGVVFLGVYFYYIYRALDELILRSTLIRGRGYETLLYPSPKIPQNKK